MRLILPVNSEYDDDFVEWLLNHIRRSILSYINIRKLAVFQDHLESSPLIKSKLGLSEHLPLLTDVVIQSVYLIQYRKVNDRYIIELNPSIRVNGTKAKVAALCRLVNYGGFTLRGYPIYSNVFNHFKTNANRYYKRYLRQFISSV